MLLTPLENEAIFRGLSKEWLQKKPRISQKFGENKVNFYAKLGLKGHNGIDFPCRIGTPIYASHDGVVHVYDSSTFGKYIKIRSAHRPKMTIYGHLNSIKVKGGDTVSIGDLIGFSGNSGIYTTGPHLHWAYYELVPDPQKDIWKWKIANKDNGYNGAVDQIEFSSCHKGTLASHSLRNVRY